MARVGVWCVVVCRCVRAHRCGLPCCPYLGMYLSDLAFVEESSATVSDDGLLVNFSKMRSVRVLLLCTVPVYYTPPISVLSFLSSPLLFSCSYFSAHTLTLTHPLSHTLTQTERSTGTGRPRRPRISAVCSGRGTHAHTAAAAARACRCLALLLLLRDCCGCGGGRGGG